MKAEEALREKQLQLALRYANMAVSNNRREAAAFAIRGKISFAREKFSEARNDFDMATAWILISQRTLGIANSTRTERNVI